MNEVILKAVDFPELEDRIVEFGIDLAEQRLRDKVREDLRYILAKESEDMFIGFLDYYSLSHDYLDGGDIEDLLDDVIDNHLEEHEFFLIEDGKRYVIDGDYIIVSPE